MSFLIVIRVFLRRRRRYEQLLSFRSVWVRPIFQRSDGEDVGEYSTLFRKIKAYETTFRRYTRMSVASFNILLAKVSPFIRDVLMVIVAAHLYYSNELSGVKISVKKMRSQNQNQEQSKYTSHCHLGLQRCPIRP